MSTPPPSTGDTWRPAAIDDIPAIARLTRVVDAVENLEFAGGPEYWSWWFDHHDLAMDTIVVIDVSGEVVALGGSYLADSENGVRAILWLDAHPDRLDLEQPLLDWVLERGRQQVASSPHTQKVIRVSAEEHRTRRRELLEAIGFRPARSFVEMTRSLTDALPERRSLPSGVSVVPWTADLDEPARSVSNASFADHWGSLTLDHETWDSSVMDDDTVRRDCSFVAIADREAVAICLTEVDPEDDIDSLWISRVGTLPAWQRRGWASALLTSSIRAGAEAGLLRTGLSVDEESDFDATAVYGRLGYTVASRSITYLWGAQS